MPICCFTIVAQKVAVKYARQQKRTVYYLTQYASAGVRISLQRFGLPMVLPVDFVRYSYYTSYT